MSYGVHCAFNALCVNGIEVHVFHLTLSHKKDSFRRAKRQSVWLLQPQVWFKVTRISIVDCTSSLHPEMVQWYTYTVVAAVAHVCSNKVYGLPAAAAGALT